MIKYAILSANNNQVKLITPKVDLSYPADPHIYFKDAMDELVFDYVPAYLDENDNLKWGYKTDEEYWSQGNDAIITFAEPEFELWWLVPRSEFAKHDCLAYYVYKNALFMLVDYVGHDRIHHIRPVYEDTVFWECDKCGAHQVMEQGEYRYFQKKGYTFPKYCKECRDKRKEERK